MLRTVNHPVLTTCTASRINRPSRWPKVGTSLKPMLVPAQGRLRSGRLQDCQLQLERVMDLGSTLLVDDVMRRWPATIRVFLDHKMRCIGCPIAAFHTVDDACHEHQVDRARVLAD